MNPTVYTVQPYLSALVSLCKPNCLHGGSVGQMGERKYIQHPTEFCLSIIFTPFIWLWSVFIFPGRKMVAFLLDFPQKEKERDRQITDRQSLTSQELLASS